MGLLSTIFCVSNVVVALGGGWIALLSTRWVMALGGAAAVVSATADAAAGAHRGGAPTPRSMTSTPDRLLYQLKSRGPQPAATLAGAVRHHAHGRAQAAAVAAGAGPGVVARRGRRPRPAPAHVDADRRRPRALSRPPRRPGRPADPPRRRGPGPGRRRPPDRRARAGAAGRLRRRAGRPGIAGRPRAPAGGAAVARGLHGARREAGQGLAAGGGSLPDLRRRRDAARACAAPSCRSSRAAWATARASSAWSTCWRAAAAAPTASRRPAESGRARLPG